MRSIIFILISCISHSISAQGNFPFPTSNAQWAGHHDAYLTVPPWNLLSSVPNGYFMADMDTVINGATYSQVYDRNGDYHAALRDVNGKVMLVPGSANEEYLLYDFTLPIGVDTMVEVWFYDTETYTLNLQNLGPVGPEGRIVIQGEAGNWIEGIGSTLGLFDQVILNVSGVNSFLDCMSHNGMTLYPEAGPDVCDLTTSIHDRIDPSLQVFPNPATEQIHIKNATPGDRFMITTVDGRIIRTGKVNGATSTIAIGHLRTGSYLFSIHGTTAIRTRVFMKR